MLLRYDLQKLSALLESFYTLTDIKIAVFDDNFKKITHYPTTDCDFCALVRQNPLGLQKCVECDRYACTQCKQSGKAYSYICHAGLTESVTPIQHEGFIIGYIMLGQILPEKDKELYWDRVQHLCTAYTIEKKLLKNAYKKMRPLAIEQVDAAAQIMEACASYLWLKRTLSLQQDSLPQQIHDYIINNLEKDLSTESLCRRFNISRSHLYKIAGEYYGKGIEQTTRTLRFEKAKHNLKHTQLSIGEVAQSIGIADYNYFIKWFKKEASLPPAQYRKAKQQ